MQPQSVLLDPKRNSLNIVEIKQRLKARTLGQDDAVDRLSGILETWYAGYNDPDKPVGVVLELGPTGVGKTTLIENLCDILYGDPHAYVRVNCAEYKEKHQALRMIGAPPSYVGYKDKQKGEEDVENPFLQKNLDKFHTDEVKLTVVLLDEIEKAHEALYDYLLSIFEDGEAKASGDTVDFRNCIFVMTSNLGVRSITRSIGFNREDLAELNLRNKQVIEKAIKDHFKPEFINRIDEILYFNALSSDTISGILDVELNAIRRRFLLSKKSGPQFVFKVQDPAHKEIVRLGFHPEYGARELKRLLKRVIVDRMAAMVGSGQIEHGDLVVVGLKSSEFVYSKYTSDEIAKLTDPQWNDFKQIA